MSLDSIRSRSDGRDVWRDAGGDGQSPTRIAIAQGRNQSQGSGVVNSSRTGESMAAQSKKDHISEKLGGHWSQNEEIQRPFSAGHFVWTGVAKEGTYGKKHRSHSGVRDVLSPRDMQGDGGEIEDEEVLFARQSVPDLNKDQSSWIRGRVERAGSKVDLFCEFHLNLFFLFLYWLSDWRVFHWLFDPLSVLLIDWPCCRFFLSSDRLIDSSINLSVDRSFVRLIAWLFDWLIHCWIDRLIDGLNFGLIGWLSVDWWVDRLIVRLDSGLILGLIGWLVDWLIEGLIEGFIIRLISWLIVRWIDWVWLTMSCHCSLQ